MKILVTGGLGYLGAYLLPLLRESFSQAELIVVDNASTGKLDAIRPLIMKRSVKWIKGDIRSFNFKKLELGPEDFIVHLAALSRPEHSFKNPHVYEAINYQAALRIARYAAQTGASFFFPSSTSVYARHDGGWIHRCSQSLGPATPYAVYKLKLERALKKIKRLKYTVARFGTIYGYSRGIAFNTAVNKFCLQVYTNKPVTVWTSALHQFRPYLSIEDATDFISSLIRKKEFKRKTYHVASDSSTVFQLLQMIQKTSGRPVSIERVDSLAMNNLSYRVSRECLKPLRFKLRGNLKKGIRQLFLWLKRTPELF